MAATKNANEPNGCISQGAILNSESSQGKLQERRREIFNKLKSEFTLPSPSGTVIEVMRLCNSDSSSLNELAETIQTDPSLSVEILKYANSAYLSTGIQVASVQKATVKLGMKTVVVLALGFSLLANNKLGACAAFDYPLFWRKSLAEAIAARELAKLNKGIDPDELFICGLLSHMGSLSLATMFPEKYGELLLNKTVEQSLMVHEFNEFGIDSAELTSELFFEWGLPVQYALAVGFHEDLGDVELGSEVTLQTVVILYLAHQIAQMCQNTEPQPDLLDKFKTTAEKFDIEIGVFSETFSAIVENWHQHGKMFDISTKECYLYDGQEA